ncbi:MAG: hypothetical protein HDR08_16780 [Lachnospiraceae bacterium]|nr:hypothetical protein [Lachnospiraceae bacterium]
MQKRDELEEELRLLRNRKEALEDSARQMERLQEEEDFQIQNTCRRLENAWYEYGQDNAEWSAMLEEEKNVVDKFKGECMDCAERFYREYRREMEELEAEEESLWGQIRGLDDERGEEDTQWK